MNYALKPRIQMRLDYINEQKMTNLVYSIGEDLVLRGRDKDERVLYVKQFQSLEELFQFVCGMEHFMDNLHIDIFKNMDTSTLEMICKNELGKEFINQYIEDHGDTRENYIELIKEFVL